MSASRRAGDGPNGGTDGHGSARRGGRCESERADRTAGPLRRPGDEVNWIRSELLRGADLLAWSVRQLPVDRLALVPPVGLGEWSAFRHLSHVVGYETAIALPAMRLWLDRPEEAADRLGERTGPVVELAYADPERLVRMLAAGREIQVGLLERLDIEARSTVRTTAWGTVPLRWVVTKTLQHTAEHTDAVLRLVLFWDSRHGRDQPSTRDDDPRQVSSLGGS